MAALSSFDLVTIDSPDPGRLAMFWCAALGLVETEREGGDRWIVLSSVDGARRLGIQRGTQRTGGIHLDLTCSILDFESEGRRLAHLGASEIGSARVEPYGMIANLADPDGNPFDLCAYQA